MPKRTPLSKCSLYDFSCSDHVREFSMALHSLKHRWRAAFKRNISTKRENTTPVYRHALVRIETRSYFNARPEEADQRLVFDERQ